MKNFTSIIALVLVLTACGSDNASPEAAPGYFADIQYLSLQGDESGHFLSEVTVGNTEFPSCTFTVKTEDLDNLTAIDGHEFVEVRVANNPCVYHMSIEGDLTRTVKICENRAEVSISCHK